MSTITFDTQQLVRELRTAGLPQEQAVAVVLSIVIAQTELVTHADLERLENKMDRRMDGLDAKIDKLSWMMGILIALALTNFAKQFF